MTEYALSVVQLCPDAYKDAANTIAEEAGYGPGNLSVELRHIDGSTWFGCHAWWIPAVLASATTLPAEAPQEWRDALAAVVTSTVDTTGMTDEQKSKVALPHWQAALAANGLVPA